MLNTSNLPDAEKKQHAQDMIALLAAEFNIPAPSLLWNMRTRRGKAYYFRKAIVAGPHAWRGITDCIVHEFAHILCYAQHGAAGKGHRGFFPATLALVAAAWYSTPDAYSWATEYRSVQGYARESGFLAQYTAAERHARLVSARLRRSERAARKARKA